MEVFVFLSARKQLKKLPKIVQISISQRLVKLRLDQTSNIKKLAGYKNIYRVRVANYRIVYELTGEKMYVILVGHRREVYKLLDRLLK